MSDIEESVASIAADLGLTSSEPETPQAPEHETPEPETPETPEPQVQVRQPPKSWAKETHELWSKADPKLQEQIELREKQALEGIAQYKEHSELGKTLREIITPYRPMIESHGLDEAAAVRYLLNAHYRLTQGTPEQRRAAFEELGRNLGHIQAQQGQQVDPAMKAMSDRLDQITQHMTREQETRYREAHARTSNQVKSFAEAKDEKGNPVHPYFDDVADDIIVYINAGKSLDEAYERAVYANPVTREKEKARLQTEAQAQLKAKTKKEAEEALKARSANVRSRDTNRSPTGTLGTMDDTMRETLANIKARTH